VPNLEHTLGNLLNALRDAPAMHWSGRQRLENQQVKPSLKQIRRSRHFFSWILDKILFHFLVECQGIR
jgi:hypothetical protein